VTVAPGVRANGTFTFRLADGSILATDGSPLVGAPVVTFALADVTPPRVANTNVEGRLIVVQFSEAVRPETINRATIQLVRTGPVGVFNNPSNVIVTNDPRAIYTYDAATNRALVDLSLLDQGQLPTDSYQLVVRDDILDLVGNRLDGEFVGLFPSGNGQERGNFVQPLAACR
jgi:hypothetical protein